MNNIKVEVFKNLKGEKFEEKKKIHYCQNYNQFERIYKRNLLRGLIKNPTDKITFKFYDYITNEFIKVETI